MLLIMKVRVNDGGRLAAPAVRLGSSSMVIMDIYYELMQKPNYGQSSVA